MSNETKYYIFTNDGPQKFETNKTEFDKSFNRLKKDIIKIEFDRIFERLKKAKHGALINFIKPAVFAMGKDKWRIYAFGCDINTDTGVVRCCRWMRFTNNPKHRCYDYMIPETAIKSADLNGDKAIIAFKRDSTEYKVQIDFSEQK